MEQHDAVLTECKTFAAFIRTPRRQSFYCGKPTFSY